MQKNNFVLDTNIWISAIITKSENDLKNYILKNNLQIFICKEMIFEIKDVLGRNKLKNI
jgi:putative PIN family toxin of toxin-antitoxin system